MVTGAGLKGGAGRHWPNLKFDYGPYFTTTLASHLELHCTRYARCATLKTFWKHFQTAGPSLNKCTLAIFRVLFANQGPGHTGWEPPVVRGKAGWQVVIRSC